MTERKQLTTAHGNPVADNQNSLTAGPRDPLLMQDYQLLEKMATFNRERVPERVVRAKGSGAYGKFTVTRDVTQYTKASIFSEIGKQTDCLLRFSTVAGERGAARATLLQHNGGDGRRAGAHQSPSDRSFLPGRSCLSTERGGKTGAGYRAHLSIGAAIAGGLDPKHKRRKLR